MCPIIKRFAILLMASVASGCTSNNCARDFVRDDYKSSAKAYCATFTAAPIPTVNRYYWGAPGSSCSLASQISSVCSCSFPAGPAVKTPQATSSPQGIAKTSSTTQVFSTSPSTKSSSLPPLISTTKISLPLPSFTTSITTYNQREFGPGCSADNCLRALDRYNANDFCSAFTLGSIGITGLPSYAAQCTGSTMARVSSACTCLNYYGNTMSLPQPSLPAGTDGTSTTLVAAASSSTLPSLFPPSSNTLVTSSIVPPPLFSITTPPMAASMLDTSTKLKINTNPVPSVPFNKNAYCYGNNCLRAMKHQGGVGATAFCASFTTAVVTKTALLPTYATQCSTNAIAQISSACTCIGSQAYMTI